MTSPTGVQYAEGRVTVGARELRYMVAGEGEPLVWLHGGFGLHPTAGTDLLTRSFHLIAFELPGIRSERRRRDRPIVRRAQRKVAGAIDALGLSPVRPARDLVRRRDRAPSRARSSGRRVRLDPRVSRGVPAARAGPRRTPETVRRGLFRHPERARRVEIDPAVMQRQRELVSRLSLTIDREALAARLRELRVPMLVMFGDADTLTPPELAPHVLRKRSGVLIGTHPRRRARRSARTSPKTTQRPFGNSSRRQAAHGVTGKLTSDLLTLHARCDYIRLRLTTVETKCSLCRLRGRWSTEERDRESSPCRTRYRHCHCARCRGLRQQQLEFLDMFLEPPTRAPRAPAERRSS